MEYRTLGRTGLRVSAVGFGCGNTGGLMVRGDSAEQRAAVARAIAAGITYFDTAAQYGEGRSEENLGRVLRELGADVQVGTKVRLTPAEVADAPAVLRRRLEEGLRRLGRDAVDVCTLHNAVVLGAEERALGADAVCGPVGAGMRGLIDAGLCRFVGFSGLGETAALHRVVDAGVFDTMQCYYNALNPSAGYPGSPDGQAQDFDGLLDRAAARGMGVFAIRILAAGAAAATPERHPVAGSSGALVRGTDYAGDVARAAALRALAGELGLESPLELAFRFALAKDGISCALIGPSSIAHVEDALRWEARGPLPPDAVARVLAAPGPPAA
jgi:L-galactose dehydrogenase/L-glyceraldehyde 3-phosphate reductase